MSDQDRDLMTDVLPSDDQPDDERALTESELLVQELPDEPPAVESPYDRLGQWFVVHTYAGYENKVKSNLESRIASMNMEDRIFEVVIPMEEVAEIKGGKRVFVQRKV